jgi:hypothetical protein
MKKGFTSVLFFALSMGLYSQSFNIKGKLSDESGNLLPSATVLLLNRSDSVMVNYALSDNNGHFEMRNVARKNYLIRISYMGYATLTLEIEPPDGNLLDLNTIELLSQAHILQEVTIEHERIPMRVRGDTIEYDALAFKPLPNETVEDLLKRMPGIVVSSDGSVEAQGETVRRVLVDGKEFFGRDPKMATQNLPADAVSKIHVFDEKSERAQFTGIDDGQRERTMNLELKEDRKEAAFGNTTLGYGPDNRFQGRLNLNRFNSKGQISLIAMGNNVNQQGFSIGDYMNFSGGTQSIMSGGARGGGGGFSMGGGSVPINFDGLPSSNGLMTSWAAGLNMNRQVTAKTEVNASYFYNQLDHDVQQDLERENFIPSGSYDFFQNQLQDNQNYNHRLNMRVDHKFNENSSLLFQGSSSLNMTNTFRQTSSRTFNTQGLLQNTGDQTNEAEGQNLNANGNLLWRHRLARPGRTLTANLEFSAADNTQDAFLNAINRYFQEQDTEEYIIQDQRRNDNNSSIGASVTYTEPIATRLFLEANYRALYQTSEINQQVFDVPGQGEDGEFNTMLSNHYENIYTYHQGGLNLLLNRELYNLTVGASVQATELKGRLISLEQDITPRPYLNVLPVARFNYNFSNFRRFMADYETSVREPSAIQIQPIVDNRDPLNIYEGNPDLRPSYRHRMQMRFNSFNPLNSFGYFAFASADYTTNAIANAVSVDENLVRTTKPVNVGDNLSLRTSFNINFAATELKSRFMIGANVSRSESVNVLNDLYQDIVNNTLGGNFRYIFRPVDEFELRLTANINTQITQYQFSNDEQTFLNQSYRSDINWTFFGNYRLQSGYSYQIYEGRSAQFDRKIPMLDVSLSRSFLKNNSGELKLSAFNLLNQDLGVTQTQAVNYYESSVTNSLGRYFMLSFTYSLNRQINPMDRGPGGGRGGMRMIMH